ncbi:MAG: cytochrome B6 [Nitrospirae bacterium]|nr:cytochrome B6 [Nitrospirota bacterium]
MAIEVKHEIFPKNPKKSYGLVELVKGTSPITDKEPETTVFTWPNLVFIELIAILLSSIILIALSLYSGAPLEEMASPDTTPNPMKAPWYFLGLQELLVFFDPWLAGVVLPGLIIVGLILVPYIDVNPKGVGQYNYTDRKFAIWTFSFGLALWYIMIVVGVYLRGLDWQWYWPWDDWELHKPPSAVSLIDYSLILTSWGLSKGGAQIVAYATVVGYFVVGMTIPFIFFRKFYKELGFARYNITMLFFLMMMGVPVKIILRIVFNIKYLLVTPFFKI